MDGEVVRGLVVGTTGRSYRGREVVVCELPPGLFGTRSGGRTRRVELTLHNGLLNQCSLPRDMGVPTPYWAVLDAAIALKRGFQRRQVIDLAVQAVGEGKRRACEMAWDVLRNHHRHERKRDAGMAYMIDSDDLNPGKLLVRARDIGETLQFFSGDKSSLASEALARMDAVEAGDALVEA